MSKGGSKPSKPEMSQSEKVQHAVSAAEWDRYKNTYMPLEADYLKDSGRDYSDRGRAQASSAVMREGTDAMRLSALGGGTSSTADTVGAALTEGRVGATRAAQLERDGRMAGALGVGREIATDTNRSLSSLAQTGARGAINDMQNKLRVDTARSAARAEMLGTLAGAGAAMYTGGQTTGGAKSLSGVRGSTQADYKALMGSPGSRQQDYRSLMG